MSLLYLFGFLFLINSQVSSTPTGLLKVEASMNKFEEWINEKARALIEEFTDAGQNVDSKLKSEITKGKIQIEKVASTAIQDLSTWQELIGEECLKKGVEQIERAKKATIWEFLHCKNLTDAVENVGKIIHESFNITMVIMGYIDHALTGLGDCVQGSVIDDIECVNNYIWKVIDDVRNSIPEVKTYRADIDTFSKKVSDDINYCLYPPSAKINGHVTKILAETKTCAKKA